MMFRLSHLGHVELTQEQQS